MNRDYYPVKRSRQQQEAELVEGAKKAIKSLLDNPQSGYVYGGDDEIFFIAFRWVK